MKSCVYLFFHPLIAFSYGEEVTEKCFIVLTFLSSMIDTLITKTQSHNFSALINIEYIRKTHPSVFVF